MRRDTLETEMQDFRDDLISPEVDIDRLPTSPKPSSSSTKTRDEAPPSESNTKMIEYLPTTPKHSQPITTGTISSSEASTIFTNIDDDKKQFYPSPLLRVTAILPASTPMIAAPCLLPAPPPPLPHPSMIPTMIQYPK